jgi:hypothetical protein
MAEPEDIDKKTKTEIIRNLIILLVITVLYILTFSRIVYEFMKETPSITLIKGDVKIFVNGVWIPLRGGISVEKIKNLRMKFESGEVSVGEKIRIKADYAETELRGNEVIVVKGNVDINVEGKTFELSEGEKIEADIVAGEIKPETRKIAEKIMEEKRMEGMEGEKRVGGIKEEKRVEGMEEFKMSGEKRQLKIIDAKINQKGKLVEIKVEGENIRRIIVNGTPFYSESGKYDISIPFEEGEHELKILAEGIEGETELIKQEKILVDITPPKIKGKSIE